MSQTGEITRKPLIGLYPGTFDPVTLGHLDIVKRALKLVDHLVIGVATGSGKSPLFSLEERVAMWRHEAALLARGTATIEVRSYSDTLQVDFAKELGASVIVRGLRAFSDFEYEFQMVAMNQRLNPDIEAVFLMADPRHQAIASRLVKEIAMLGGEVKAFTSPYVAELLIKRCKERTGK
ncbi:MAG TPA: pantetheine-phosphate adenylyltransferase [Rhizomicrobium sp.]|nr:pantetheine-phosphate adenylyltransferase [Rhizomicrobium sp.]